jgi:phenylacetate-CoA ligase
LRGYASSFNLLARYCGEHKITLPSVKIVIAGSEALDDGTRELVERYLSCNIISQYANEENGILAQECIGDTEHRFYLNEAGYFFEVLKLESNDAAAYGEVGRLVITDLFNYAFPLIRYDCGDNCIMELDKTTGRPYISKLYGRRLDMVYNVYGEPIFPMAFARILKNYEAIVQWQFVQNDTSRYSLLLINKKLNEQTENEIIRQLYDFLGDRSDVKIEYFTGIPVLSSGKRKPVVNLWKNQ